ncbi:rhomboid family intramembrane serine protease [Bacillus sp. V3B]|uniref:rhomboid family intramembrane serine protease n=1 Tax=Bacillus sp. V3B TaxID=2804915 RepID=UPI00210D9A7C|nr:rhomboid family intramembrane serine protease [Bacillus sp. V3B]MCQ6273701.1 rhomboid family intramembrane serine protease [Bacillus sp. V3B]
MSFREEFLFWKLAHYFVSKHEYRIVQLSKSQKELWLEKMENKEAQVIRILLHNLDWSNWMQRDIQMTLTNGESIRKQLRKRFINVINIYVTPYPPVDDYQFRVEKPLLHPNGEKTKLTSVICDRQNGVKNIETVMGSSISIDWKDEYDESDVEREKQATLSSASKKVKSEKDLFENGKPFYTYIFIAIQLIIFFLMEAAGGSTHSSVLIEFGAKVNSLILEGEWWRLWTPIVLHIGLLHLVMNTLALYYLGPMVERLFGNSRFLFIYLFAGFSGSLGSLLFSPNISAGASGAIFGCFGALLYFGTVFPKLFFRTMGLNILIVIGINLVFGFSISGIDNAGHIGGLIGGFLAAAIVHFPKKKRVFVQLSTFLFSLVLIYVLFQYSFAHSGELINEQSALILAQEYVENEDYDKANVMLNEFLSSHEGTVNSLFLLSFTEIKTGKKEEAKAHLHEVIEMESNFHEAFYNLALIYLSEGNYVQAKGYAMEASEKQPSNADYQKLVREITDLESAS